MRSIAFSGQGVAGCNVSATQSDLLALPFLDPFSWQVFFEDFAVGPPVAAAPSAGWAVAGAGSAASQVGLALTGAGQLGEGGSSLTIATGAANGNTTVVYPASSVGLGTSAFVTRFSYKARWILAARVTGFRQPSANVLIGTDVTGFPAGLPSPASGPSFYAANGSPTFSWGAGLSVALTGLRDNAHLVFDDLLAFYADGFVTLFVNGQNIGSTAASPAALDTNNDAHPILGLQTLTAASRGIGVDYFMLATPRDPV